MTNNTKPQSGAPSPKVSNKSVKARDTRHSITQRVIQMETELENQRGAIKYLLHYSKEFNNEIQQTKKKKT